MRAEAWMAMLATFLFVPPVVAQTTRPADELAKENAELKQRIEKLEAYVAELEKKVRSGKPVPRVQILPPQPFRPAPYGYELPALPFKLPVPAPLPKPPAIKPIPPSVMPNLPPQSAPEHWKRREFNGAEYYLVPLR